MKCSIYLFFTIFTCQVVAHPNGNIISVGDKVLWSYIAPINDPGHHACVMIWDGKSEPSILLRSEYTASDFFLFARHNNVYMLERKYVQSEDTFECRLLKMTLGEKPVVIWDWFEDTWRVGEAGFYMLSDSELVFARNPRTYRLKKGQTPIPYHFKVPEPIRAIKEVEGCRYLLLSESSCWLAAEDGTILKTWKNLLADDVENPPLNLNRIFDMDYRRGELLLAYWGNRSFKVILPDGSRKTILQLDKPYTAHWVAFRDEEKLLFSSEFIFDGRNPSPNLVLANPDGKLVTVWKS